MPDPLSKVFVGEDLFSEKMDNLTLAIIRHGSSSGESVEVTSWKQVQQLVRAGLAPKVFSVGDKFIAEKESAITITCSNSNVSLSINAHTFVEKMGEAGNKDYEATYDGIEWHDGDQNIVLSQYGITINSGTPVEGDKIVVHETATDIEFIVMDFDAETPADSTRHHSMTLGMKYTFDGVVFDAREAFFYNGTNAALPAGTYYFKVAAHSWASGEVGKYIQFTLTQDLPVGGQLVFTQDYNAGFAGKNIKVFASNSTKDSSPTETVAMSEGNSGTYLGELKNGLDSTTTISTYQPYMNHCQRAIMGSNNWEKSAIRQWANANAAKGTFWEPTNPWDRMPSWHDTSSGKDGFLYNLDPELVKIMGECVKKTEYASCDGTGRYNTTDKVWLFSREEIQSSSSSEAATYPPYKWWHNLLGETYGDWRTDTRFIKRNKAGSAQYWWLRSPHSGFGHRARIVNPSGYVDSSDALYGGQAVLVFAVI